MTAHPTVRQADVPERWPSERPIFVLCVVVSLALWAVILVTIVGAVYAAVLAAVFFLLHVMFVSYVRGNAVRLGSDQFPELYARVEHLARQFGLEPAPEAYLMQAGGALNAFATRFLRANMIVLYSDLLEACGQDTSARDMIVAHELGHLAAGHLRYRWLIMPAAVVPFLSMALSRAREYTCDRYGLAGAGNRDGALLGLTILAAGGPLAPQVNRQAFVRQRQGIATGWMTIGEWLSTHPPLCRRLAALDHTLGAGASVPSGAPRALGIMGAGAILVVGATVGGARFLGPALRQAFNPMADSVQVAAQTAQANSSRALADLRQFSDLLEQELAAGRPLPESEEDLYALWDERYPGEVAPLDPFDGLRYGYQVEEPGFRLWSSGPDGESGTDDDIVVRSGARL